MIRKERDRRGMALLDLDLAAEDLNCILISILFWHIWKMLASYMRRHSVNENPTDNKSYTYLYMKTVHIDSLNNIILWSISHIGKYHAYCFFFNHSIWAHTKTRYFFNKSRIWPGWSWVNALMEHIFPQPDYPERNRVWPGLSWVNALLEHIFPQSSRRCQNE